MSEVTQRWSKEGEFAEALQNSTTIEQQLAAKEAENLELRAEVERLREALVGISRWLASWRQIDLSEECADGGVLSGMVVQQEAKTQMAHISATLAETQP